MPYRTYLQPPSIPAGYEIIDEPGCLTISWRARGQPAPSSVWWFAGMCGIVVAHLLVDPRDILFHLLATLILGLVALVQIGDRVKVAVRGCSLVLSRSPITPQARVLTAGEIAQLYAVQQHDEKKHTYELWCQLRGGGRLRLLRGLESADAARYLERILECRLEIPDRPVEGELARRDGR
jgi:hypothetical protein